MTQQKRGSKCWSKVQVHEEGRLSHDIGKGKRASQSIQVNNGEHNGMGGAARTKKKKKKEKSLLSWRTGGL
jgi:hypothetical protein